MAINPDDLLGEAIAAIQEVVETDWPSIKEFAERQAEMIAKQAALVTELRVSGPLRDDDALFEFFLEQLEQHARNLANSVAAMTLATLEKAWNAVVGVIWGAINGELGRAGLAPVDPPQL